ncbi:MAG TPA: LD-carboxypeptidase [Terriglobales bacterium]|jgi:muramoyltetrapeptide carboxypeptidase|nr:LD-carboxypeptidase [Terriglobales bacterium]
MPSSSNPTRIKPPALHRGDVVGIVASASYFKRDLLEAGCDNLRSLGYKPFYLDSIFDRDLYFAGSAERRARELHEMFVRDEVRAILCARGGYGSNYLLSSLDLKTIKAHPKIFAGYSDLTTLLTHITDATGLITFQGPMVAKDFASADGVDLASWESALSGSSEWAVGPEAGMKALVEGTAEGMLYGGCLSMLVASLGTPYEIRTAGSILFIEDIATKPYQIDRMLMQLKLSGKLADIRGIIFGEMVDCVQNKDSNPGYTLEEIVLRVVDDLGVPVAYGLRSGHVSRANITLPIGVRAALNVQRGGVELKILEAATAKAVSSSSSTAG